MLTFQVILWLFCGSKDPSHLVQQDWICPNLLAMDNQSTNYLTGFNFQLDPASRVKSCPGGRLLLLCEA